MAKLILVRHGRSVWNLQGLWTGWTDIPLADPEGYDDAKQAAQAIKDLPIDKVYCSSLIRARQTWDTIQKELNLQIPVEYNKALDERNYGIYAGKNKWEVKKQLGEKEFENIRRGYNVPIPEGETLKDVYDRIVPYYQQNILPLLKQGQNILISAHGNSLRALVKHLENLTEYQVVNLEIGLGEVYVYNVDNQGQVSDKEVRAKKDQRGTI